MKLNMFEVIFAICFTVQNVSEPLLILTERSIMAYIALGKLLTKNRQFQMLITFEPFIRFLQMKAQKSS
jgi:hypothetical protein